MSKHCLIEVKPQTRRGGGRTEGREELLPETRAESELKGSFIASARDGFYANAHTLSYPALLVSAAIHSFAGMLIAFAFPLSSVWMRLLSEVLVLTDLIFYFNKGKRG